MDYIAHQAPLSMEFPKQEYRSGLPFLSPGDLPHRGIEPESPALQAESLPLSHWEAAAEDTSEKETFFLFILNTRRATSSPG